MKKSLFICSLVACLFSSSISTANMITWVSKSSMSIARCQLGLGVVNNKIYAISGNSGGAPLQIVEEYDPITNIWSTKANIPTGRTTPGIGVVNNKIYVIGGDDSETNKKVEEYDPTLNSWTEKTSMPTARRCLAAGVVNGKIYAIGGDGAGNCVEEYDPVLNSWATKANIPTARYSHALGVIDNKIYVVGGYGTDYLTSLEVYDPVLNSWTTKTSMPTARFDVVATVLNGKLYVSGGANATSWLSTVEVYDPNTDTWTTDTGITPARAAHSMETANNKIYAIGGWTSWASNTQVYNTVEEGTICRYTVSGYVKDSSSVAISGVSVTLSGSSSTVLATDSNGFYQFTNLDFGNYVVTPAKASYVFSPVSLTYTNLTSTQTNQNFMGTYVPPTYSISGYVKNASSTAISGVAMTLSGSSNAVVTTAGDGSYSFTGLINANYTITPTKTDYTFSPVNKAYSSLSSNRSNQDFTGTYAPPTYSISGYVKNASNTAISGVTMTLSGSSSVVVITVGDGSYAFNGLVTGNYTITPSKTDHTFSPLNRAYSSLNAAQTNQDFTGTYVPPTYSISGYIKNGSNIALAGVDLTISGGSSGNTTTDSNGFYQFIGLVTGNYTVVPTKNDLVFSPSSKTYTSISTNYLNNDYVGTLQEHHIVWTTKSSMSIARCQLGLGVVNNKIYAISGNSGGAPLQIVEEYDPITNIWSTKANIPTGRTTPGIGVVNNKIYVIGGDDSETNKKVEEYDPTLNSWTEKTSMPTARRCLAAGVVNGKIYAIGGDGAGNCVEEYDPVLNSWATKANIPTARYSHALGVIDNKIYVVGGYGTDYLTSLEVYDPVLNSWTTKTSMPTARFDVVATVLNGKLYVSGGANATSWLSTVEVYDPNTDTWTTDTGITPARAAHSMETANNKIYAIGGWTSWASNTQVYNTVEEGTICRYTVSGYVKDSSSVAISGVSVTLSGSSSTVLATDSNGFYQFTNLDFGNYVVTPAKASYVFSPVSLTYTNLTSTRTNQDFTGTYTPVVSTYYVNGSVVDSSGTAVSGVTITLTGASNTSVVTDANGAYSFASIISGSYIITPSLQGYTFSPVNLQITIVNSNLTGNNFTAARAADLPPAVKITVPGNRQVINGNYNVKVEATDDVGISKVEYYIDGDLKHSDSTIDKFHWLWDTTLAADGEHTLKVIAYDTINQTASAELTAIIHQKPNEVNIVGELKPVEPVVEPGSGKKARIRFKVDLPADKKQQEGEKARVHVNIAIYTVRGTLVKTLIDEELPMGESQALWDGRNFAQEVTASGAYIVKIQAGDFKDMKKIVVVK